MNAADREKDAPGSLMRGLGVAPAEPGGELDERILQAAVGQIEDFGLRRFTIEDVARRAGVSRMTVYRYHPKKHLLIEAVLQREVHRFLEDLEEAVASCETLEERLVEGLAYALSSLQRHRLLNRLLQTEPESFLPALTLKAAPVLATAREFVAHFARANGPGRSLTLSETENLIVSELLVRIVFSFVLTPDSLLSLETPAEVRRFARHYLAPILHGLERPSDLD